MYKIKCGNAVILDPRGDEEGFVVLSPKIKLEVNTVGEGSFTIYNGHPNYKALQIMKSIVEVSDDAGVIFRGRITENTVAFDLGMSVDLEGAMAFFNDSVVHPFKFPEDFASNSEYIAAKNNGNVVEFFLKWLIDNHNEQVEEFQRIKLGTVTVSDPNNYITRESESHANTWEIIKSRLIDSALGGYLCPRYEEDGTYIDYLAEFTETNTQEIVFGENLMDLSNKTDGTATYSAIIPLGAEVERTITTGSVEGEFVDFEITKKIKERITIKSLSDGDITADIVKVGDTLYSRSAVEEIGWIYAPTKDTTWDDVTSAKNLLDKGVKELETKGVFSSNTIEFTAADLHFTNDEIESFRMYKNIVVRSDPHNLMRSYPLSKLELDLLNPQNTKITGGETRLTLIDKQNAANNSANSQIKDITNKVDGTISVTDVKVLYYKSTSAEECIGGEWTTESPETEAGYYVWTKQAFLYSDGTIYETDASCDSAAELDGIIEEIKTVKTTADGKNSVYFLDTEPTGGTYKENDLWFNTASGNAMYTYKDGQWILKDFGSDALQASAITAAKIAAGAVTAEKISVTTLEAIAAKIGGFNIKDNALYNGRDSMESDANGVYVGTDGISLRSDSYGDATLQISGDETRMGVYQGGLAVSNRSWQTLMDLALDGLTYNDFQKLFARYGKEGITLQAGSDDNGDLISVEIGNGNGNFSGNLTVGGTINAGELKSSIFTGNLSGNVTGDVTGNVTGDVTGNLNGDISKVNAILSPRQESNEITAHRRSSNDNLFNNPGGMAGIRNALRFRWYDSYWRIGNIRSSSTGTYGFGFELSEDGGSTYKGVARIGTDGTYYGNVSGTATKATQDGSGNNIASTYATVASVSLPMVVGTEYRTTKQWNGNVIYAKLVDLGETPSAGSSKTVNVAPSGSTIIKVEATGRSSDSLVCRPFPIYNNNGATQATIRVANQVDLTVSVHSWAFTSAYSVVAYVEYTKA